jgi:hypothetical protein
MQAIIKAEADQADKEWLNFRASHSDNRIYGDLDPRFIDRNTTIEVHDDQVWIGVELLLCNRFAIASQSPLTCLSSVCILFVFAF